MDYIVRIKDFGLKKVVLYEETKEQRDVVDIKAFQKPHSSTVQRTVDVAVIKKGKEVILWRDITRYDTGVTYKYDYHIIGGGIAAEVSFYCDSKQKIKIALSNFFIDYFLAKNGRYLSIISECENGYDVIELDISDGKITSIKLNGQLNVLEPIKLSDHATKDDVRTELIDIVDCLLFDD